MPRSSTLPLWLLCLSSVSLLAACGEKESADTAELYQQGFDAGYATGKAEIDDLRAIVEDLQARMGQAETSVADHETRLGTLEGQSWVSAEDLGVVEDTLRDEATESAEAITEALDATSERVDAAEERLGTVELVVASHADQLTVLDGRVTGLETTVAGHTDTLAVHTTALAGLTSEIDTVKEDLDDLEDRVGELEAKEGVDLTELETRVGLVEDDVSRIQADYLTSSSLAGYATEAWVMGQGYGLATDDAALDGRLDVVEADYLRAAALTGYATEAWVTGQGYATETWVTGRGYATESWVTGKGYGLATDDVALDGRLDVVEAGYLEAADLSGYATQAWVSGQGYATQSWVSGQGYGLATDVTALDGRLDVVEAGYLEAADLSGYATQSWVSGLGYAFEADLDTITADLAEVDGRVAVIEGDYLVASNIDKMVELIDADTTYPVTTASELLAVMADLDRYRIAHDVTVTIDLAPGTYSFTEPLYFRHPDGGRITIQGDGTATTTLYFPSSNGIYVDDNAELGYLTDVSILGASGAYTGVVVRDSASLRLGVVTVSYFGNYCVNGDNGATVQATDTDGLYMHHCMYGAFATDNAFLETDNSTADDITHVAYFARQGGVLSAGGTTQNTTTSTATATPTSAGGFGYYATTGGHIDAENAKATNNAVGGFGAYYLGSIDAYGADSTTASYGFRAYAIGTIFAQDSCSSGATTDYVTVFNSSIWASSPDCDTDKAYSGHDTTDWIYGL